jgi:hypothetical protein
MTTYTTLSNALVGVGAKPFATTIQALRDNPIAIGEADSTVPAGLLPTVLLGTLTTTSGATQTLSSLVLTQYKILRLVWVGVSHGDAITNRSFLVNSVFVTPALTAGALVTGFIEIDLSSEVAVNLLSSANSTITDLNINNSTTSISVSVSGNSFDAGSIRFYGVK